MSRKQWRLEQKKLGQQKQKKEEKKKEKKSEEKEQKKEKEKKKKKRPKKKRMMKVKKVAEQWEIWNKEEVAKSREEVKKLVLKHFYKWIHVFGKKQSERMPIKNYKIILLKQRKNLCLGKERCIYCQERRERRCIISYQNN